MVKEPDWPGSMLIVSVERLADAAHSIVDDKKNSVSSADNLTHVPRHTFECNTSIGGVLLFF